MRTIMLDGPFRDDILEIAEMFYRGAGGEKILKGRGLTPKQYICAFIKRMGLAPSITNPNELSAGELAHRQNIRGLFRGNKGLRKVLTF